ncbi:MAG: hypothetical protein HUK20_12030 [Fibrobacter sp.]|nr:hypothetical protein [Fibrobacter sp.]
MTEPQETVQPATVQQETVSIHVDSLGRDVAFPIRHSEFCKKCKGVGEKNKKPCPYCCGSGEVKTLDCIRCNGKKYAADGTKCKLCKGEGVLSETKTRDFLEAREFCEDFKKNPAKILLIFIACLVALGICSRIVCGYAFVDINLVKTWPSYISLLVGLLAGGYVLACVSKMNKGSYLPGVTKALISAGVVALGIAAVAIPGPVTGQYSWIEGQAEEIITENVASQGVTCESVKVSNSNRDDFYGVAHFSDRTSQKIVIHYIESKLYSRNVRYSIQIEPLE